jgi:hypothetical protein
LLRVNQSIQLGFQGGGALGEEVRRQVRLVGFQGFDPRSR